MTTKTSTAVAFLTGLGMLFLGTRFLLSPEVAEAGYGLHFAESGDYAFHSIKGIRDIFSGLLICAFVLLNERRPLAVTLLLGAIIPLADLLIVLSRDYNGVMQTVPHVSAIFVCLLCGGILLRKSAQRPSPQPQYIQRIQTAVNGSDSIMELNLLPGEKTPWHYHTLFSETFEITRGVLEVGRGKQVQQLAAGDVVTIAPAEHHYYHNVSGEECRLKVTLDPGNSGFEESLLILKGLAADGLASAAGTPKRLTDLALFVRLNNSRMVGVQKLAEPLFGYMAERGVKNGRLAYLESKYVFTTPR